MVSVGGVAACTAGCAVAWAGRSGGVGFGWSAVLEIAGSVGSRVDAIDVTLLKAGSMFDSAAAAAGGVVVVAVDSLDGAAGAVGLSAAVPSAASRWAETSVLCVGIGLVFWAASACPSPPALVTFGSATGGGSAIPPCSMVRSLRTCCGCDGLVTALDEGTVEDVDIASWCDSVAWIEGGGASGVRDWESEGVGVSCSLDVGGAGTGAGAGAGAGAAAGVVDCRSVVADRSRPLDGAAGALRRTGALGLKPPLFFFNILPCQPACLDCVSKAGRRASEID